MNLLTRRCDLERLVSANPSIVVGNDVSEPEVLERRGLVVWVATPDSNGGVILHGLGASPRDDLMPVELAPPNIIAVVHNRYEFAEKLSEGLVKLGLASRPAVIAALSGLQAAPAVLERLLNECDVLTTRCVELLRALAATRIDYEETRVAMAAAVRVLGDRQPGPRLLALATRPSEAGPCISRRAGRIAVRQNLGLSTKGIAALSFYVASASFTSGSSLRVRLYAAESGRIFGSWTVPGADVRPGWFELELVTPVGPVQETAVLEITADLAAEETLSLALDRSDTNSDLAAVEEGYGTHPHALVVRVWTADHGSRFSLPKYWNWDEAGYLPPLLGVPLQLPGAIWSSVRTIEGKVEFVGVGSDDPRPTAKLHGGERAVLTIPALHMPGMDVIRLDFTANAGDANALEAGIWLQPVHVGVETINAIGEAEGKWAGWRAFDQATGKLSATIAIPGGCQEPFAIWVILRNRLEHHAGPCTVEWSGVAGVVTRVFDYEVMTRSASQNRGRQSSVIQLDIGNVRADERSVYGVSLDDVRVDHHYATSDGNYEHIDVSVHGLTSDGITWPTVRFKIAQLQMSPQLEFRLGDNWPECFVQWPGLDTDNFGAFFLVKESDENCRALAARMHDKDRHLLRHLLNLLPFISESAVRHVGLTRVLEQWVSGARSLQRMVSAFAEDDAADVYDERAA